MIRKIAAVAAGVLLGVVIAFARAGAFPFWGSGEKAKTPAPAAVSGIASQTTVRTSALPEGRSAVVGSFAPLVKRVMPTVVNVSVVQNIKVTGFPPVVPPGIPGDPFEQFRRFFGQGPREFKQRGLGSGVIISPDGYILTNNHVVGDADEIHVTLMDKREFTAKVVGRDPKTDLALIKINSKEALPVAELGNSEKVQVGDWVVAIGNPFSFSLSVTAGIVSAKGRILSGNYDDFIQTDASINPGNSGGPLFDTGGRVIGINTLIYSRTGANNGIGFAIPVNLARNVVTQLKERGRVIRGWLGVEIQRVTPDLAKSFGLDKPRGALVAGVDPDGPAKKAGIRRGDVIVKFAGHEVTRQHDLPGLVAQTPVSRVVNVVVLRNGKRSTLKVKVGELKEAQVASARSQREGSNWGMQVGDITPEIAQRFHLQTKKGVVIRRVRPGSPAADAGLQAGDVVLEVDRNKIDSVRQFLARAGKAKRKKKSALLLVKRGSATLYTVIKPRG